VTLIDPDPRPALALAAPVRSALPGLVGSGPLWLRACSTAEAAFESGSWLAVSGEPGTGKLALTRSVYQRGRPGSRLRVLDAAEPDWVHTVRREFSTADSALVIRHVDRLTSRQIASLTTALQEVRDDDVHADWPWFAVTFGERPQDREFADLLRLFPSQVELPPLRHHVQDVADLVPAFLARLSVTDRIGCSPEALQMIMRATWPGNVGQLWQVIKRVVSRNQNGLIQPDDLPPECRTVSRRLLSPLEAMERDAIVASLVDANGNKARAAKALGMSRATIYRKVHEYGIIASPS
jgi:transcriptional regulator with GAF, ATPase, and Fis domain